MLNIHDLETRWFKYKLKRNLPYFMLSIFSIFLIYIIFLNFFDKKAITLKTNTTKIDTILNSKNNDSHQITELENTQNNSLQKHVNDKKLVLQPSFSFIKDIQTDSYKDTIEKNENFVSLKKTIPQTVQKIEKIEKIEKKLPEQVPNIEVVEKNIVNIKRNNEQENIQHVIKRFKQSNNPALSLFIAKKYYELGNYKQAYNYAFITNGINNDIEESWLIFAKSLVKLNEKEKAIKILKEYIKNSHSQRAQVLLKNITSGKLQ